LEKENEMNTTTANPSNDQYSLAKILGIWLLASVPMGILGWIVAPALSPDFKDDPIGAAVVRIGVLTLGLIWQFVLAMIIVRQEAGNLRWSTIKKRLWLNKPRDPRTGQPRGVLWLWVVPFLVLIAALEMFLGPALDRIWVSIFPFFAEPAGFALGSALESPEIQAQLVGAWGFLGLFFVNAVFNTILGEEFLFRGVLLPKMEGVFGKWDWVANGVLHGAYHFHQPWGLLGSIVSGVFLYTFPSRRFRSIWMGIIVHSGQSVLFLFLMLGLVLGLA
jgi:membrane protease YdiL (CAAX protease family)